MVKRGLTLLLACCMLLAWVVPAQARDDAADYESALTNLKRYLIGDSEAPSLEAIGRKFDSIASYKLSRMFGYYVDVLEMAEQNSYRNLDTYMRRMRGNPDFCEYLEITEDFMTVDELYSYAMGCKAQHEDRPGQALRYFYECATFTYSQARIADLEDNVLPVKYLEAAMQYSEGTLSGYTNAYALYSELAQGPYLDSVARAEEAKRCMEAVLATPVPTETPRPDSISVSMSGSGDVRTITVTANGSWTAVEDQSWVTLDQTRGSSGSTTITVTLEENPSSDAARTGMIVFTCGSAKETVNITQERAESALKVTLSAHGNSRAVKVTANGSWMVKDNSPWITLNRMSGNGTATLTMTLEENPSSDSVRTGTVTFVCGDQVQKLTVTQAKAAPALTADLNGSTITVTANGSWMATSSQPWIGLDKTSGSSGTSTMTVTLEENPSCESTRSGKVTITCGSEVHELTITQAKAEPSVTASMSGSGDTRTITVTANGNWTATDNQSWITLDRTSGSNGTTTVTVTLKENLSTVSTRTGTVTLTCGSSTAKVTIVQDKAEREIAASLNGSTITVTANSSWTAASAQSWITLDRASGGGGSSKVKVTLSDNPSSDTARTGTVTFTCGNKTAKVNITQEAAEASLRVTLSAHGDTRAVRVTANGSWTAKDNSPWITLDRTSGTGTTTLTMTLDPNPSSDSTRTGSVLFVCGDKEQRISVVQAKAEPSISVSESGSGNTRTIQVTVNGNWTATASQSWVKLGKTSGSSGMTTVAVTLDKNPSSTSTRSGTVTFTCGSKSVKVNITQAKAEPSLTASLSGSGNSRTIQVTANGSWTATASQSWITLSRKSGSSGTTTVTVTLGENPFSTSTRSGTVTFTCGSKTVKVSITQAKGLKYKVGEIVTFGHYELDGKTSNGRENLEWIVLDVNDGLYFLTTTCGIERKPYDNSGKTKMTWEKSSLRKWLNEEFYNTAFTKSEAKLIVPYKHTVKSRLHSNLSSTTKDNVFLLTSDDFLGILPYEERLLEKAPKLGKGVGFWWLIDARLGNQAYGMAGTHPSREVEWLSNYKLVRPCIWVYLEKLP